MIYIASPYSHPTQLVMEERVREAFKYAARLKEQGRICFSPVVYGHQFYLAGVRGHTHYDWLEFNERILEACSEVHVLMLHGYENSLGVAHEVQFAKDRKIPHLYVMPE